MKDRNWIWIILVAGALDATPATAANEPNPTPNAKRAVAKNGASDKQPNPPAVTEPESKSEPRRFSAGLGDIVKMVEGGIESSVIEAYIRNSTTAFNPAADEILALHKLGVSPKTIAALIEHGGKVRAEQHRGSRELAPQPQPRSAPPTNDPAQSPNAEAKRQAPYYTYVYPPYSYPAITQGSYVYPNYEFHYRYAYPPFFRPYFPRPYYSYRLYP